MNLPLSAVLFDFDGVLADTEELTYGLRKELEPSLTEERFRGYFAGNIFDAVPETAPSQGDLDRQAREYAEKVLAIPLKEGLVPAIRRLSETYELAVVSSTPSDAIRSFLTVHGLERCFSAILGSDVHREKSVKIRQFLGERKIAPHDAALVTDTLGDIREARRCGVHAIAVDWGFHSRTELQGGKPDDIVSSADELEASIRRILGT